MLMIFNVVSRWKLNPFLRLTLGFCFPITQEPFISWPVADGDEARSGWIVSLRISLSNSSKICCWFTQRVNCIPKRLVMFEWRFQTICYCVDTWISDLNLNAKTSRGRITITTLKKDERNFFLFVTEKKVPLCKINGEKNFCFSVVESHSCVKQARNALSMIELLCIKA